MDGKVKRGLRSRSERDRRRDEIVKTTRCPSSGSDLDQSPVREHGPLRNFGRSTNLYSSRPPRLPRRKRRRSACQEDIIDGFAIASFLSLDFLELALRQKTQSLRLFPDRKEKWERRLTKRKRTDRQTVENALMSSRRFIDHGDVVEAEVEGETERRKSSSNKQRAGPLYRTVLRKDLAPTAGAEEGNGPAPTAGAEEGKRQAPTAGAEEGNGPAPTAGAEEGKRPAPIAGTEVQPQNIALKCKMDTLSVTYQRTELTRFLRTKSTGCQSEAESSFSGRGYSRDSESDIDERMTVTEFDELLTFNASTDAAMDVKDKATVCRSDRVSGLLRSQEESSDTPFTVPTYNPAPASSPTPISQPETRLASTQTMALPPVCVKKERASPHTPPSPALSGLAAVKTEPQAHSSLPQACSLPTSPHASHDSHVQEPNKPTPPEPFGLERRSSPTPALPLSTPDFPVPSCFLPGGGHHRSARFPNPLRLPPPGIIATGHPVGASYSEHDLLRLELNNRFLSQNAEGGPGSTPPLLRAEFHQHQHNLTPYPTSGPPTGVLAIERSTGPNTADQFRAPAKKVGRWCAMHAQIAWQIHLHQQRLKQLCGDSLRLNMRGKLDLFSRSAGLSLLPGLPYLKDLTPPLLSSVHLCRSPFSSPYYYPLYLPNGHLPDRFNQTRSHGSLRNIPSDAYVGLGFPSVAPGSPFSHRQNNGLTDLRSIYHDPWNRLHQTLPPFTAPEPLPKSAGLECKPTIQDTERENDVDKGNHTNVMEHSRTDGRSEDRGQMSTFSTSFQISNLIGSCSPDTKASSPDRKRRSPAQGGQSEMDEVPLRKLQIKQRFSPSAETLGKGTSEPLTVQNQASSETSSSLKTSGRLKQEQREQSEVVAGTTNRTLLALSDPPGPHHPPFQAPHPSSGHSTFPNAGGLQGTHLPHSLPLPMTPRHPVSSLSALEQARVQPFTRVSPQSASQEHLAPPLPSPWEPLRERDPYRGLYLQCQQLTYDPERVQRQREAPSKPRIKDRQKQTEQRARLHQLQGSPMEGHLAHTAPSLSSVDGAVHPRLSPSAPHSRHLNRTPPTSIESAMPPLISIATDTITRTDSTPGTGNGRPASPSGATPSDHAPTSGELPFSKPKEVEAK